MSINFQVKYRSRRSTNVALFAIIRETLPSKSTWLREALEAVTDNFECFLCFPFIKWIYLVAWTGSQEINGQGKVVGVGGRGKWGQGNSSTKAKVSPNVKANDHRKKVQFNFAKLKKIFCVQMTPLIMNNFGLGSRQSLLPQRTLRSYTIFRAQKKIFIHFWNMGRGIEHIWIVS